MRADFFSRSPFSYLLGFSDLTQSILFTQRNSAEKVGEPTSGIFTSIVFSSPIQPASPPPPSAGSCRARHRLPKCRALHNVVLKYNLTYLTLPANIAD